MSLRLAARRHWWTAAKRLMEQAPILDERTGRTLVPLRFIAQTMGHAVLWDGKRRKITILKN